MAKPPATKKLSSKNKDGSDHRSPTSIFGPNAVTRYLCIPRTGNITGVELAVFLPELLRTPGVLYRFLQNGADAQTLAKISSLFRTTVKDHHTPAIAANAMRHVTQSTMRRHLKDDRWTETRHKAGWYKTPGQVWDHDNLTFAGVQNYCEDNPTVGRHKRRPIPNVRFALLAVDIAVFPSGDDELDLTRCVKAAAANEDFPLMFPRDYTYLTWLLGGPQIVRSAHRDRELFNRWRQMSWVEMPSEYQVNATREIAHYKFTTEQKAATEQYLQQCASIDKPTLDAVYSRAGMPISTPYGSCIPSANGNLSPVDSVLVGQNMHNAAVDSVRMLPEMSEDSMDRLYSKWLVAHGTSDSEIRGTTTSTSDVVRRYLESDRSIPGPLSPTANETVVIASSSGALSNTTLADGYESLSPPSMDWYLDYQDSLTVPVGVSYIDLEMLDASGPETTGSFGPEHNMRSSQVGSEDTGFDSSDGVGCAFAPETL
ncbi:hypothetical protein ACET3X_006179 [Alternaria dauci]|uniref:Uncharacterized protein n=1 Tax=Alternaria dauci TaxID=48095 RepID=A0ABR3UHV5_9PLEO